MHNPGFEPYQSRTATGGSEHVWVRFKSRPTHFYEAQTVSDADPPGGVANFDAPRGFETRDLNPGSRNRERSERSVFLRFKSRPTHFCRGQHSQRPLRVSLATCPRLHVFPDLNPTSRAQRPEGASTERWVGRRGLGWSGVHKKGE